MKTHIVLGLSLLLTASASGPVTTAPDSGASRQIRFRGARSSVGWLTLT